MASLAFLAVEVPWIVLAASALGLLVVAAAAASGAAACLLAPREEPLAAAAPLLFALLPAWLVTALVPGIPVGVVDAALPGTFVLAATAAGLLVLLLLTRPGLVAGAARIDAAAAGAIGLPLPRTGRLMLAAALPASLLAGIALAAVLPGDAAWLAVAAPAALAARGDVVMGFLAAGLGGAVGMAAVLVLQQPPIALAGALLLAAALPGGLRSVLSVGR